MYVVTQELQADIERRFTYHKPGGDQPERYQALRGYARELALVMCRMVPESRERSLAVGKLEEAIFWANAGIARREQWSEPAPPQGLPPGFEPLTYKPIDEQIAEKGFATVPAIADGVPTEVDLYPTKPEPQTVQVEPMGQAPAAPTYIPPASGESPLSE